MAPVAPTPEETWCRWDRSPTTTAGGAGEAQERAGERRPRGRLRAGGGRADPHLLLRKKPACPQRLHGLVSLKGQGLQHHLLVTQRPLCLLELGSNLGRHVGVGSCGKSYEAPGSREQAQEGAPPPPPAQDQAAVGAGRAAASGSGCGPFRPVPCAQGAGIPLALFS